MELGADEMVTPHLRLVRELGRGGMGSVWVADHLTLETEVAVKFVSFGVGDRQVSIARFRREATAAAQIQSPHVVQIFDHGVTDDGTPYIVMELLRGESLAERLAERRTLDLADVALILKQLAKALSAAHHAKIIHRDIKPENIFCVAQAGAPQHEIFVKLLDFGIARPVAGDASSQVTETGALVGTPAYMSPEQLGDTELIGPGTDLWALAVVAYRAICGRLPFEGDTPVSYWRAMMAGAFPLPSAVDESLPAELDGWCRRAFQFDPADRFESARAMSSALEEIALERSPTLSTLPRPSAARPPEDRVATEQAHADTELANVGTDEFLRSEALEVATGTPGDGEAGAPARPEKAPTSTPAASPTGAVAPEPVGGTTAGFGAALATGATRSWRQGQGRTAIYLGAVALTAGALWLSQSWDEEPQRDAGAVAPAQQPSPRAAAASASAPPLREPVLGLAALGNYHDPQGATIANLKSSSLWAAAARDFAEASEQEGAPTRWRAGHHFAACQQALVQDELEAGAQACRKAAAIEPTWAPPHAALAAALSRQGDLEAALEEAETAQRLEPKWWRAVAMSAGAYSRAGKLDEAIQEFRRALELAPDNAVLLGELALMYHAAKMDSEANRYAEQALAADADLVPVRVMRAEQALLRNQGEAALAEATRAVAVAPKDVASRLAYADAHALLGHRDQAMAEYRRVLELRGDGDSGGAPEERLALVEKALAANVLPRPRHAQQAAAERSRPSPRRSRPKAAGRSRPDFELDEF